MRNFLSLFLIVCVVKVGSSQDGLVSFDRRGDQIIVQVDGQPIASYVMQDPIIRRPYFANVRAPGNLAVTRNHPPVLGVDALDHDTMHPGMWLAFGDLNGHDYWRNQGEIQHVRFIQNPAAVGNRGTFIEEKRYLGAQDPVCSEEFRFAIQVKDDGYLFTVESIFSSDQEFFFGDQEEMGFGIRVATDISEVKNGRLRDSQARSGAKAIWSHPARWCDYSGIRSGERLGVTLLCHPDNFRVSWLHARNYGLLVANPFGRRAMHKGEESRVVVRPGESIRLRYGVWIHHGNGGLTDRIESVFQEYATLEEQD